MKIKIKTSEIDFEFENDKANPATEIILPFIKDCIKKVSEETINIKAEIEVNL